MYKVVEHFKDLQDNRHAYNPGDIFPRDGLNVSWKRLESLAGSNNGMGKPLIELVKEKEAEKPKEVAVQESKEESKPVKVETAKPKKGRKKSAE